MLRTESNEIRKERGEEEIEVIVWLLKVIFKVKFWNMLFFINLVQFGFDQSQRTRRLLEL